MSEPVVAQDSPIEVEVQDGKKYYWCTCGKSDKQPFCDGSHKDSDFTPLEYTAEKDGKVWLCACKQTKGQPFCDGSHKTLSDLK